MLLCFTVRTGHVIFQDLMLKPSLQQNTANSVVHVIKIHWFSLTLMKSMVCFKTGSVTFQRKTSQANLKKPFLMKSTSEMIISQTPNKMPIINALLTSSIQFIYLIENCKPTPFDYLYNQQVFVMSKGGVALERKEQVSSH